VLIYHFSTVFNLRPDDTPGTVTASALPPLNRGDDLGIAALADGPLVWLTTDRDSGLSGPGNCVRITIELHRMDDRLKQWLPWARETLGVDFVDRVIADAARRAGVGRAVTHRRVAHWWFYRGEIPPALFEAIEILDGQPWWLV
jgi:hypothetical protein